MTIKETKTLFEELLSKASKKSEIRLYEKFVYILTQLSTREFKEKEIQTIETELEKLQPNTNKPHKLRFSQKALYKFETFLKKTFSLTTKDHYTTLGTALGMSFGIAFGLTLLSSLERSMGITIGLCAGMILGMVVGKSMDAKAKRESRVL